MPLRSSSSCRPAPPCSRGTAAKASTYVIQYNDVTIAHPTITLSAQALGPDAALAAGPRVRFTQTFTYRDGTLRAGPRKMG